MTNFDTQTTTATSEGDTMENGTTNTEKSRTRLATTATIQTFQLLQANGAVDPVTGKYIYNDGWDDARILAIIRALPGHEKLSIGAIQRLRREEFGPIISERRKREESDELDVQKTLQDILRRLERLERDLGVA